MRVFKHITPIDSVLRKTAQTAEMSLATITRQVLNLVNIYTAVVLLSSNRVPIMSGIYR